MTEYLVTTRNITGSAGQRQFGPRKAGPYFLATEPGDRFFDPDKREKGPGRRLRWGRRVVADAQARWAAAQDAAPPVGMEHEGDIVVFVHGFNIDAQDCFEAHRNLAATIRNNGFAEAVFVSFSWPANGEVFDYYEDDQDARGSALDLVSSARAVFAQLSTPECRVRVHVMAHSMGSLVVREALRDAPGSRVARQSAWGIANLITFGADISTRSVRRSEGASILEKSQRWTNYFNRHDGVLATSNAKRFLSAPRLGRHGVPRERRDEIADVDMTARWEAVQGDYPVDTIERISASHNFYFTDQRFGEDAAATLRGLRDRHMIASRAPQMVDGRFEMRAWLGADQITPGPVPRLEGAGVGGWADPSRWGAGPVRGGQARSPRLKSAHGTVFPDAAGVAGA
ncbi:putative lipoprotein [Candidatus Rhodobacter oscarellae]|uniref:Putative lipoprotein n=1 Tax=Candidatus Rhodobacter oscarellae TaxID=1675527 RepID=A0A0J9E283_9RHOB|nr:alpha/beta fold hydrolase [Candidatus Rhodobacter lobularis]KMW56840.1 putative lipoprotein [Candidatus Rhodobacter lobularis]